jgi:serine protease
MMNSPVKKLLILGLAFTLLLIAAAPVTGATNKVRVFVQFSPNGKSSVQSAISQSGGTFHYTFDDLSAFAVSVPADAIRGLYRNPNVVRIVEDSPRYPILTAPSTESLAELANTVDANGQTVPYGIDAVQARDVWDFDRDGNFDPGAPTGGGVTVCIIDTGFYSAHEDLSGIPLVGGIAQVDPPFTNDGFGHGTHVAGTIAAQNNDLGVVGVSPGVSFYIVKYFGDDGAGQLFASDLISGTNACANNGSKIISMSLGGTLNNYFENVQFNNLYSAGILSIAAAGNAGDTTFAYPASYGSVVSVAAVDEANNIASFSQQNNQVELAAPGVSVLSTLPYIDETYLTVGGISYQGNLIANTPRTTASGSLVDGGICDSTGSWSGMVVLCERGAIGFYDKVMNVQNSGGVAAVIYNNTTGNFLGTLGDGNSSSIIGISLSQEDGQYLVANYLGSVGDVSSDFIKPASGYKSWNGTSMATPHVSAVAALLWSANPSATNSEIRNAMTSTALDLGSAGRDNAYGFGLVQAKAALDFMGGVTPPTNNPPEVTITSPADGSSFEIGETINFVGVASDNEDDDATLIISWESDLQGPLGTGDSLLTSLNEGTHTITASTTDSGGLEGFDSITVTVTDPSQNSPPVVLITAPADGASFEQGQMINLTGIATDVEDLDISADIAWYSSIDQNLGTGASLSTTTLSVGTHTITASVTDSGGLDGEDSITVTVTDPSPTNNSPSVSIISPEDLDVIYTCTTATFIGSASDPEDGDLSSSIVWNSNVDNYLGTGASIDVNDLSEGFHTITASVTDTGNLTDTASILVLVSNTAPQIIITSPGNGSEFEFNTSIDFSGYVLDAEETGLDDDLIWTSNLDDQIGTGPNFSSVLSEGQHTITASVADRCGVIGSTSIDVIVLPAPPDPALSVTVSTDKDDYTSRDKVQITVHVTDGSLNPVANASVSVTIASPDGRPKNFSGITDSNGEIVVSYKFNTRKDGYGAYAVTATATLPGYLDGNGSTTFNVVP